MHSKKRAFLWLAVLFLTVSGGVVTYVTLTQQQAPAAAEAGRTTNQAAAELVRTLQGYGLQPESTTKTAYRVDAESLSSVATWLPSYTQDVIATLPGTRSQGRILLYARYNPNVSPSHDEGSGSKALLKLIEALGKQARLQNDLTILFTASAQTSPQPSMAFETGYP